MRTFFRWTIRDWFLIVFLLAVVLTVRHRIYDVWDCVVEIVTTLMRG
jgi:hypothetical protein